MPIQISEHIKLKRTPIKEIVLSISFEETLELSILDNFKSSEKISSEFSSVKPGFHTHVTAKSSEPPTANVSIDGYILRSKSSTVIQARKGSISFHKVNGYEEFGSLLNSLMEIWSVLLEQVKKLTVNKISVRYLNLIDKDKHQDISEILNINLSHPFGTNLSEQLIVIKYKDIDKSIAGNITIANQKTEELESVLLDINLTKSISNEKQFSFDCFYELRNIKNNLFFTTITKQTILKYNS